MPSFTESVKRIAIIAPVGPDIWNEAPEKAPIKIPPITAVTMPAAAEAPDPTPKARANGKATAATVMPAIKSFENVVALYPLNSFLKSVTKSCTSVILKPLSLSIVSHFFEHICLFCLYRRNI